MTFTALLGAGFSNWAAELPLATELFDFRVEPFGTHERNKLTRVMELKRAWDVMYPQNQQEEFISYILNSTQEKNRKDLLWYIVRRLSEPYIWYEQHMGRWRRHVLMIDEHRKMERPGIKRAQEFFSIVNHGLSGIVTTNYDLIIEYALGTKGFHYGQPGELLVGRGAYPVSQWNNPIQLRGILPIAKLHGSISWDYHRRYTDGRRGLTGNALIVAPTPEKVPPSELIDQWELSKQVFQKAKKIVVFGFGFNPYDKALLNHLHECGEYIHNVLVIDVRDNIESIRWIWPHALISRISPSSNVAIDIQSWLANK